MTEGSVLPVKLGEGPLQIEPLGCSVGLVVSEIAYADSNIIRQGNDAPYVDDPVSLGGNFTRKFFAGNRATMTGAEAYVHGYPPHGVTIDAKRPTPDASSVGTVTPAPDLLKGKIGQYTCSVNAAADRRALEPVPDRDGLWEWSDFAMRGHSTAFVHQVSLHCPPVEWRVSNNDPVDIRPAIESMSESCVDPAIQPGAQWQARIDRTILKDIASPLGGSLGNDYGEYVGRYHPIVVETGWVYEDGVQRAYAQQGGTPYQWLTRLSGFQVWPSPRTDKPSERWLDASWSDPIMLLRAPFGVIDARFAPLDFLMAQKMASGTGGPFYGRDAVAYILRMVLGYSAEAALYPATPMNGQYSLLDYKIYTDPPSGGGFLWPPPFGQSAWQWIMQIAEWDFSVFYFAITTAGGQYRPVYGNYFELVRALPTTSLPDAVYASGDESQLIGSMETTGVPEQDYNRWLVWGQAPGQPDLGGLMPALPAFSAESRIEASPISEQNIAATGERTKIMQGTQFWLPKVAKRVADNTARIMTGVNTRRISLHVPRGVEWLWWGHKVTVPLNAPESDLGMDLRGKTFRLMKVNNRWDFKQQQYQQTLNVAEQPVNF